MLWVYCFQISFVFFLFFFRFFVFDSGGRSIWAITPEERDKHDQKFDSLSPTQGFVSGMYSKVVVFKHLGSCLSPAIFSILVFERAKGKLPLL